MNNHECISTDVIHYGCRCYIGGLEPDDSCPIHGGGEWPPKCGICGKFMKWEDALSQKKKKLIHLNVGDSLVFAEGMLNPPEPNEKLKSAKKRYDELVGE